MSDEAQPGTPPRGHELRARTVRGAFWMILSNLASRMIGVIGTLVLTRYVAPAAYGDVAAASIWILTANQISTIGVGMYVIARPDSGRAMAFHATVLHLGLGVISILGFGLARSWLGGMVASPHMEAYVPGLVIAVLLDRVRFMPERILVRNMRFGVVSMMRGGGELIYTAVSLVCAVSGLGAMSIVWGNIARALVRAAVTVRAVDWRDWIEPCRLRLQSIRELLRYGVPLGFGSLIAFGSRNWDSLMVGHYFGSAAMGKYQLAYNFADIPAVQIGEQIGDVLLPSFVHMEDRQRVPALIRSTTLLALIMFPMAIGLGAVAPTAVSALLDAKWSGVAPMLVILSALSVTRPIGWTIGAYLSVMTRSRTQVMMALECGKIIVLLGAIALTGGTNPLWSCTAVGVAFALHALASMLLARHFGRVPLRAFLSALAPPLLACLPMVLAILAVRQGLQGTGLVGFKVELIIEVLVGALAYLGAAAVVARRDLVELLSHARRSLSG